jgi:hypothetical protein
MLQNVPPNYLERLMAIQDSLKSGKQKVVTQPQVEQTMMQKFKRSLWER